MTWTYSADPSSSTKDAVRFLLGDTDPNQVVTLQDEEIAWTLAQVGGEVYRAASNSASNLGARYVGQATSESKTVGGLELSTTYTDRAKRFNTLAAELLKISRRVNPPLVSADPEALGAEFKISLMDPYYAIPVGWPNEGHTDSATVYGTMEGQGEEDND